MEKWRARIGWILPRRLIDNEAYDFYQIAPKDVVLVCNHLNVRESSDIDECRESLAMMEYAVDSLLSAKVDIIIPGGEPVQLSKGLEGHRQLVKRLQAKSSIPIITSIKVITDALKHVGAKRVYMIVAWPIGKAHPLGVWSDFVREEGLDIAGVKHIQHGSLSIHRGLITSEQIHDQIKAVASENPDFDALFIQCGGLKLFGKLQEWEEELGKPIVSSSNAKLWGSFRPFNITVAPGYGKLLASLG